MCYHAVLSSVGHRVYGQAAVTYRFPSDHRSQASSSGVSTWMGDHWEHPVLQATLGAVDTWRSRDFRSAECASLITRILHNSPLQSVTGVWNLSEKKKKKQRKTTKKKNIDATHGIRMSQDRTVLMHRPKSTTFDITWSNRAPVNHEYLSCIWKNLKETGVVDLSCGDFFSRVAVCVCRYAWSWHSVVGQHWQTPSVLTFFPCLLLSVKSCHFIHKFPKGKTNEFERVLRQWTVRAATRSLLADS